MNTIACHTILRACSLAVVLFVPAMPFAAHAQDQTPANADSIAKMVRLMTEDGYSYKTTKSSTVWAIHFTGKRINDIKVVVTIGGDADSDLIVFVTVVQKQYMPVTADFMSNLLKQNHEIDQVKIGYDADGDLEVRTDTSLRLADAEMLKNVVEQVKNASDEIYGRIQPSLVGADPHPYAN
ncbi:MAG TPA: YbjN domain-containing protein [Terracidiphilus sp.]|nr:YbjN domain-containing protein [Terracidiphilus sp.]